jgi:PAS domain S-box-containing protein
MISDEPQQPIAPESAGMVLSQYHLETIFRAMQDVVLVLDGETQRILYVNDTAFRVLGYSPGELIGAPFSTLLPEDASDRLVEAELVDGTYGPMPFRCANGEFRNADVTVAVVPWDGHPALLYSLRDATQRTRMERERENLILELREALSTVKQLSGLLPICANCKRIRDDQGEWSNLERYISARSNAEFSHGICPTCREELYPELGKGKTSEVD